MVAVDDLAQLGATASGEKRLVNQWRRSEFRTLGERRLWHNAINHEYSNSLETSMVSASKRKLSTREKIVSAAADRFHEFGYSACGVQEIVDAAGVPKGSFYNHFKAKELLAVEVLGTYWQDVKIDLLADKSVGPVERIRGHFEHIASLYAQFGYERGCLIGKFVQELSETTPRIRDDVVAEIVRWIKLLASTIREGQADGSIAPELDADRIARFLINSWGGAAAGMKIVKSRAPLDDFFSTTFSLLLKPSLSDSTRRNPVRRRRVAKMERATRAAAPRVALRPRR